MTLKEWAKYRNLMSQICRKASDEFRDFAMQREGGIGALDRQTVLEYAYALVQKYGQASGELACMFYEQIAEAQNVVIPPAEMAVLPEFGEVAKAVNGAIKQTEKNAPGVVERLTKQVGADTMLQNAKRDGAHFAWITSGDTCAYCMMMSAIGWQKAGKNTLRGNHAEHIHAHCDCQYVVDFKGDLKVDGYDPEGMRRKLMGYADPDGKEYGGDFNRLLNMNGRQSMRVDRKGLKNIRNSIYREQYLGVPKTWIKTSISDDDALAGTNPNYNPTLGKRGTPEERDYNDNCSNCVPAYEMRRRGYPVTAQPLSRNKKLESRPFDAWEGIEIQSAKSVDEMMEHLEKYEDGARFQINRGYEYSVWESKEGHTFSAEKKNGKIVFIDPQINGIIDIRKSEDDGAKYEFARIDKAEISDKGKSACKKEG